MKKMKSMKKINILLVSLVLLLGACSQYNYDPVPEDPFAGKELTATYTIKQLVDNYTNPNTFYNVAEIQAADSLIIKGIVTSHDEGGNVYKYIIVQEEVDSGRAIRVGVDLAAISAIYPLGQRLCVYLNDLNIGNYGQSPQVGIYGERNTDGRQQPAGMPASIAKDHIFPYGKPDASAVVADTMTIAEILSAPREEINYRLICIKDAWFTGRGANFNQPSDIPDDEKIFAPGTDGIGFPQSREIQDGTGSIFVATSEYSKFADKPLPASNYVGNITAIVSWYNGSDNNPSAPSIFYQLTLRSLEDLGKGFEGYLEENL